MPYSGVPESKTEAMEKCVESVMADGKDKESAIKICRARIVGGADDVVIESADIHFEIVTDPTEVNMVLGQDFEPGELLRWKGAELARAEINANRDELSNENIASLAGTLPLMPLTMEHDPEIIGLFTAAESAPVQDSPDKMRLITDGVMYARRFPEIADEIRSGKRMLSVEAFADIAICSMCGGEYPDAREYCEHLRNRHVSGASRRFADMRAVGGGAVRRPAGTHAGFNQEQVYMIASHDEMDVQAATEVDEGGTVELEEVKNELAQTLARLEAMREERDGVAEERDELQAKVTELEASVNTLTAELEEVNEEREQIQADLMWKERSGVLASAFDQEELERQKPVIMSMSDEAVSLMAELSKAKTEPEPVTPSTLTANLGDGDDKVVVALV